MKGEMIDLCRDWIETRNGAYLAKENVIVYYASHTGRVKDFNWVSLTLNEVVRVISAMHLEAEKAHELKQAHVISACQELDRVYEFGMRSSHNLAPGIFNYVKESGQDISDSIMDMLSQELFSQNHRAMLYMNVKNLFIDIAQELKADFSHRELPDLIHKYFTMLGYDIKIEAYRPLVKGKKQPAIMMPGTLPRDIVELNEPTRTAVKRKVQVALK